MTYIPHRRPLFPLHEAPQVSAEALSRDFGRALKRENDTWPLLVAPSRPCRGMDAPPGRGQNPRHEAVAELGFWKFAFSTKEPRNIAPATRSQNPVPASRKGRTNRAGDAVPKSGPASRSQIGRHPQKAECRKQIRAERAS